MNPKYLLLTVVALGMLCVFGGAILRLQDRKGANYFLYAGLLFEAIAVIVFIWLAFNRA